ncbi:hypothetical protein SOVF_185620 isoform B, partial [Spinacia oleracea]
VKEGQHLLDDELRLLCKSEHLEESVQGAPNSHEVLGDSVAWGEVEVTELIQMHKNVQGIQL